MLKSKTICITGAAHGIGKDAALALAKLSASVIAMDSDEAALMRFSEEVDAQNSKEKKVDIHCVPLDITDDAKRDQIAEYAPDIFIANAAIGESGPLSEIPLDRLRNVIETNIVSTVATCQIAAQAMIETFNTNAALPVDEQKALDQRIIIVGSTAGLMTLPYLGPYNMTKFALEAAADALRMELAEFNISVSLIEPGKIDTGFNQRMTQTKYRWLNAESNYAEHIDTMKAVDAKFFSDEYPVGVVTKGIVHAATAKKPKTRYITPKSTGYMIKLARLLPDSLRDAVMKNMFKM